MSDLSAFARLIGMGWRLARADALVPREAEPFLPAAVVALGRGLRLFAGPQARLGRPGARLARVLERSGPVAIKLGQFLATRADIFGDDFANDLSHLKDRLAPFAQAQARAAVEAALGRPIDSLYRVFGPAVAAASIAQAHRATLLDGREVAVKVLRPDVEGQVARDSAVLALAARLVTALVPAARRLEPTAFAATVIRALTLELDLRFEAAGADELAAIMAKDGYMNGPSVVWDGVGRRALTLTWAYGVALSDSGALDLPGLDRPALANALIRGFLSQALDHGLFHADLHEGNLFIAAPSAITAVDFGILGRLGPLERRYLAEILWGFLSRDYARIAALHFEAGYVPAHHDVNAFAQALRAVGEPVTGRNASDLSMGRLLAQLFEITALFDMRLRPELVLLQKTMVTVEGVARRIDPNHDLWAAADPVVRRWISRELSPAAKAHALLKDAADALSGLARLARAQNTVPPTDLAAPSEHHAGALFWFAAGALCAGLAFLAFAFL
jgi:ubiquinone biosynthesis protein